MLYPDAETRRQLAREHQATLKRDFSTTDDTPPRTLETRRRWPRLRLRCLRFQPAAGQRPPKTVIDASSPTRSAPRRS